MSRPTTVVLLVGADADAPAAGVLGTESTPFLKLRGESANGVEVRVVSLGNSRVVASAAVQVRLDATVPSLPDRLLRVFGAYALRAWCERSPIGRLLNTLGPIDPSRVFWRTLRRNPEALELLRTSDVAIATDLETTKAAWLAVHRGWVDSAFYDHRALAIALDAPPTTA